MKIHNYLQYIVSYIIIMLTSLNAQLVTQQAQETSNNLQSYPIIGSHLLKEEEQSVKIYIEKHPEMFNEMKLAKPTAWSFNVGDPYDWYAVNFTNSTRYLTKSTCRAVGSNCYIFVEDSMWLTRVNQAAVDSVRTAFDLRTPANSQKGIYQIDTSAFGNPPDVDTDPRIIILILNIKDGFTGTGGYIVGYFSSYNQTNLPQSNRAEIFFLDANPLNLLTQGGLEVGMSTTSHEFQHMIHWNNDMDELTFINESCSLVSEVLCGYPINDQSGYINETNHYLFDWRTNDNVAVLRDYSRASRFSIYYHDQFGASVFKPIVANTANGITGIDGGLQTYGTSLRFDDLFETWLIANILNDTTVNSVYGYKYAGLPKATGLTFLNPNVSLTTDTVQHLGARYLSFKGGTGLNANFTVSNASIQIKAVEIGPGGKRVLDVTPGTQFSEPNFGTTYTEVHFVVMNTSLTTPYSFTYQATGGTTALELKWDTTEPTGYLPLARKDTVCVTFDGVQGGKLDSIRVALRRAGSMTGGVWRFTGNTNPTPLGQPLAVPITASISTTPPSPYPVP
ncbi:MAG: hypothetical protein QME52_05415 [Bacteroidota bacterium]|nr:hypothetical protein [Bacteroidota bacterium]